jgi:hypothetical protein
MPFVNAIPRCNATTLEGCNDQEKTFIEKFQVCFRVWSLYYWLIVKGNTFLELQSEFDRLNNLDFEKISKDGKGLLLITLLTPILTT